MLSLAVSIDEQNRFPAHNRFHPLFIKRYSEKSTDEKFVKK
jgi:hypothetical protein